MKKDSHFAVVKISPKVISMCVVLVMAKHKRSDGEDKSYSMLDICSQSRSLKNSQ